jgi:hypothetical protein
MGESMKSGVGGIGRNSQSYHHIAGSPTCLKTGNADVGYQVASCVGHRDCNTPRGHIEIVGKKQNRKEDSRNEFVRRAGLRTAHPGIRYLG